MSYSSVTKIIMRHFTTGGSFEQVIYRILILRKYTMSIWISMLIMLYGHNFYDVSETQRERAEMRKSEI